MPKIGIDQLTLPERGMLPQVPSASPQSSGTTVMDVIPLGGMCYTPGQWDPLEKSLSGYAIKFKAPNYPHRTAKSNGELGEQTIGSLAAKNIDLLQRRGRPVCLLAHSMGAYVASEIVEALPQLVKGVIAIAPAVPRGIRLPSSTYLRLARPRYLVAIAMKWPVELAEEDSEFIRDGSDVPLGRESGVILRQLGPWGYPVPRLTDVTPNVALIAGKDDLVIPIEIARKVARYHDVELTEVSGGHYPHRDPRTNQKQLARLIAEKVIEWSKQDN